MEENSKKKQKTGIILAVVLSVVSILLLGYGFITLTNPKTVLLQSIGRFTNGTKDALGDVNTDFLKDIIKEDKVSVSSNINISMNDQKLFEADLTYLDNRKDKKSAVDISLAQKDEALLDASMILANNNLYLKVKDIMDYYYTEFTYASLLEEAPVEDYQKVIDYFYDSVKEEINEKDIKKSKETIKLGNKDKKTTKLSYAVTEAKLANILSSTVSKIEKDDKLITALAKSSGVDKMELVNGIKSLQKELKDAIKKSKDEEAIYYNVYYYGFNNIALYELVYGTDSLRVYEYNDTKEVVLAEDSNSLFTLKMTGKNDNYDISGKIVDYSYNGTYSTKDDKSSLSLNFTIEGVIINLKVDENVNVKDHKISTLVSATVMGTTVQAQVNTVFNTGDTVDTSVIKDAKSFDEISDTELQTIMTNLQKHPLYSLFSQYLEDNNTEDDDTELEF